MKPTNQRIVAERSFAAGEASRDGEVASLVTDKERLRDALRHTLNACAALGDKAGWRHSASREELVTIIENMRDEARKGFW